MGRAAGLAGTIIVALMIQGTIPVQIDDAWLWSLLALFIVTVVAPDGTYPHHRSKTD
jgi:hypothetical protein